jgi:murein DD-endopeptidase MepM/ murein hydrolase activator NlpD
MLKASKDRIITIWIMADREANYSQFQVNLTKMKKAAAVAALVLIYLPCLSFVFGALCAGDRGRTRPSGEAAARVAELDPPSATLVKSRDLILASAGNSLLSALATVAQAGARYQEGLNRPSRREVKDLNRKLAGLENRMLHNLERTQRVVGGMETDLQRWVPLGNAGGDPTEEAAFTDSLTNLYDGITVNPIPELPPSQLAQINNLKTRLSTLDNQLTSSERSLDDLTSAWGERNVVFAAFPTYWPVSEGQISSPFGMRIHPISGQFKMHTGVDINTSEGIPISAASAGLVTFADTKGGYGLAVLIDHGYGISTLYGHCSRLLVKEGDYVERGRKVAEVGSTGLSTGPHLHFEIRVRGIPIDPMNYLIAFSSHPE